MSTDNDDSFQSSKRKINKVKDDRKYVKLAAKQQKRELKERKYTEREVSKAAHLGSLENAFLARGLRGNNLIITSTKVVISHKSNFTNVSLGLRGDKEIDMKSITSIQIKRASMFTNGFFQISFIGGQESKGGLFNATHDENTVMFNRKQEPDFIHAKQLIDEYRNKLKLSSSSVLPSITTADELSKFADLVERGFITKEEFEAKKKQLLGLHNN